MDLYSLVVDIADHVPLYDTINIDGMPVPLLVNFRNIYQYVKTLGQGASGSVKCYREVRSEELFAFKEIPILGDEVPGFFKNIRSEVYVLQKLSKNSDIVKYYGSFAYRSFEGIVNYVIITEYIEGFSLDYFMNQLLAEQKSIYANTVLQIGYWLFDTLSIIHDAGYVHRDIKPHNIMVDIKNRRFVLIDFGLACSLNKNKKSLVCNHGSFEGTSQYMAPESFLGSSKKHNGIDRLKALDIWAAGITLYFLIENKLPWTAKFSDGLVKQITSSNNISYNQSNAIRNILDLCFQKNPDNRPSASQLRNIIANIILQNQSLLYGY